MKFIDAHLPPSLCNLFKEKGFDAIHTSGLPQKNATSDNQITELSMKEERIVITKDSVNSVFNLLIIKFLHFILFRRNIILVAQSM